MLLNTYIITKALEGVALLENPTLWDDNGRPTEEHFTAIKSVHENLDDFRQIVLTELQLYPNTKYFFDDLIRQRLLQEKPLSSPIIQILFPTGPIDLENRLDRIAHIPNINSVSMDACPPKASNQGAKTDEVIRDSWSEFFVADFLVSILKVNYVEKVTRGKSQPAIDFCARKENENWIVEVARLRKRDFQGETMPWGSKDCAKPENVAEIKKALRLKLFDKNKQIQKFINNENCDFDKRFIAIKTSQEEYQDCSHVIAKEAKRLMDERSYSEITHVLLIYDTKTYEFIENFKAR